MPGRFEIITLRRIYASFKTVRCSVVQISRQTKITEIRLRNCWHSCNPKHYF